MSAKEQLNSYKESRVRSGPRKGDVRVDVTLYLSEEEERCLALAGEIAKDESRKCVVGAMTFVQRSFGSALRLAAQRAFDRDEAAYRSIFPEKKSKKRGAKS